eukprot:TRINITY_DN5877_c0_g1_i1.p1 TRINITY_DN5877_c0_g1~~TRINITY_DN5877_c0_g1_i1.p1  ORF type:complete len:310 (-),score=50.89 TRINITY_DN5877_c0_g1_i1:432-1361(-)
MFRPVVVISSLAIAALGVFSVAVTRHRRMALRSYRRSLQQLAQQLPSIAPYVDSQFSVDRRHFDTIDSTNAWGLASYRSLNHGNVTVVTAAQQTAGRGRGERQWISPANENIYASFVFVIKMSPHLPNLTQLLALSAISALRTHGVDHAQLKWPNDIVVDGQKLGGILAQSSTDGVQDGCMAIVLGIGLNVNMPPDAVRAIARPVWPATSVLAATGRSLSVAELTDTLVEQFAENLRQFLHDGYWAFVPRISALLALNGEQITMDDGEKQWTGVQEGVNQDGMLQVRLLSGELRTFVSAEHVHNVRAAS